MELKPEFIQKITEISDKNRPKEVSRVASITTSTLWNIITSGRANPSTVRKLCRAYPQLSAVAK